MKSAGSGQQAAGGEFDRVAPARRSEASRPLLALDRRIAAGLFILAFVTYGWFFGGGGWNQNAHFDLTRALVERQTLHIDGYRVNTGDISWSTHPDRIWHAYSNKPPGLALLAAIPYAALHAFTKAPDTWQAMTLNAYLLTLFAVALPGALIPAVLYGHARRQGAAPSWSLFAALVAAFGTILFPYATVFYSVVPAALFLLLAFVWREERPLLAGGMAGMLVLCFYVGAFAVAVIAIGLFLRSRGRALMFVAGGLPFAILLGAYHTICFGAPWRTTYAGAHNFEQKGMVLGIFRLPSLEALWGLTFSEFRGLFWVSPVLLLIFFARHREWKWIGVIAAVSLLVISSFFGWDGAFAFGPRHLLPVVPLLALLLAFLRGRTLAAIGVALAIVSVSMQFVAAAVDVEPDVAIRRPVRDYLVPTFLEGKIAVNAQSVDELIPNAQHPPGSHESSFASFNLGELLLPGRASLIPIALWMIAGSVWLVYLARR